MAVRQHIIEVEQQLMVVFLEALVRFVNRRRLTDIAFNFVQVFVGDHAVFHEADIRHQFIDIVI